MNIHCIAVTASIAVLVLAGCSDSDTSATAPKEHVWKEKTQTLDQARSVEQVLQNAAQKQRRAAD